MKTFTLRFRTFFLFAILSLFPLLCFGQIDNFVDEFEDGSLDTTWNESTHTLWETSHERTYSLSEQNGELTVSYTRTSQSGSNDFFTFNPPEEVNVSDNPTIRLRVRSSVSTTLTLLVYYSFLPVELEELVQEIPGDNTWHTYVFNLDENYYEDDNLLRVNFSLDRGTSQSKSGTVSFDSFSISEQVIRILNFTATTIDSNTIELDWESSDPEGTALYRVYRSSAKNIVPGPPTFVTNTGNTGFISSGLNDYSPYYFRVLPVDTLGEEQELSKEIRQETYQPGVLPEIEVTGINTEEVAKYEKLELKLGLDKVGMDNPYNPDDIDIRASFTSPSGIVFNTFGFYDNYEGRNEWKVRFSANETGTWTYSLELTDAAGTSTPAAGTFTVTESSHKGWIKPSTVNPHYFVHDDGSSYYGVGVYSPWQNNETRFKKFAEHEANLFAIWDITYGGFLNGYGVIENELGRYNQEKVGRIDSLLNRLEKDNIKLMYAIWPHDLFSASVWATEWDVNPYNQLIDADEVYGDSLVWEYQKKKYRYMIARFSYSRSMGIWEIINEMNGTDGWMNGYTDEAYEWVGKVDKYFEENDPYNHPTTASFSGGYNEYRQQLYELNDIPNIHFYEEQGWPMQYEDDPIRSSVYNYSWASRRFWNNFDKPAIFGEAGASLTYVEVGTPEYDETLHNALWASLSNGLAAAPVWWAYPEVSEDSWDYFQYFKWFVEDIDVGNEAYDLAGFTSPTADAFGMKTDRNAFGWMRNFLPEGNIEGTKLSLPGLSNGTYSQLWYDTWTGNTVRTDTIVSAESTLRVTSPGPETVRPDIAFKINAIENGTEARSLELMFKEKYIVSQPATAYTLIAYITDNQGRLVDNANHELTFTLNGAGSLSTETVSAAEGIATVQYTPEEGHAGTVSVTVEADGLSPASLYAQVVTSNEETFNSEIPDRFALSQNYPNPFNPVTVISYQLPVDARVKLDVFDVMGRKIATLVDKRQGAGTYQIPFTAKGLSSGVYFYMLETGKFRQMKQMVLIK